MANFKTKAKLFKAEEGYVLIFTVNETKGYVHYEEVQKKFADKIKPVEDLIGKRRAEGIELTIELNKEPSIYTASSGKSYLDMENVEIKKVG